MEHKSDSNCNWNSWNGSRRLGKETGRVWNRVTNKDYPDYNIITIGQNTEKSPGDLRRLAVTKTPVKDHQLRLIFKEKLARNNDNNNNNNNT